MRILVPTGHTGRQPVLERTPPPVRAAAMQCRPPAIFWRNVVPPFYFHVPLIYMRLCMYSVHYVFQFWIGEQWGDY